MADELELLKMRKLLELQKRMLESKGRRKEDTAPDPYRAFYQHLTPDGREMFERALRQYSGIARRVAISIGRLYLVGRLRGLLNSETVYGIFYELGYPIRIETRIVYKKGREVKTISELLKEED